MWKRKSEPSPVTTKSSVTMLFLTILFNLLTVACSKSEARVGLYRTTEECPRSTPGMLYCILSVPSFAVATVDTNKAVEDWWYHAPGGETSSEHLGYRHLSPSPYTLLGIHMARSKRESRCARQTPVLTPGLEPNLPYSRNANTFTPFPGQTPCDVQTCLSNPSATDRRTGLWPLYQQRGTGVLATHPGNR